MIIYVLIKYPEGGRGGTSANIFKATKDLREATKWLGKSLDNDFYIFTV